jgi:HJR/Mrr/RecB family endonuclease
LAVDASNVVPSITKGTIGVVVQLKLKQLTLKCLILIYLIETVRDEDFEK